jgi:hypothetical protein
MGHRLLARTVKRVALAITGEKGYVVGMAIEALKQEIEHMICIGFASVLTKTTTTFAGDSSSTMESHPLRATQTP